MLANFAIGSKLSDWLFGGFSLAMPTNPHPTYSAYLVQPTIAPRLNWSDSFRSGSLALLFTGRLFRTNPRLINRTILALALWTGLCSSVTYLQNPKTLSAQSLFTDTSAASTATARNPLKSPAISTLSKAVPASALTDGPTGQLLPPGTMAADGTYPNSYTRGQCTWYVAGRRQVPSGWGNAVSWFSHAQAAGWSTGTTPAVAAIAWTPAGSYGHVAVVEQVSADNTKVQVSEMNFSRPFVKDKRWVAASAFKYIY
jgi:surface antigen